MATTTVERSRSQSNDTNKPNAVDHLAQNWDDPVALCGHRFVDGSPSADRDLRNLCVVCIELNGGWVR
jgi:hypothetical protein